MNTQLQFITRTSREYFVIENISMTGAYQHGVVNNYLRDIDEMEYKNTHKMQDKFNVKTFKFPCGELLPCVSDNMNFALPDSGHHIICRSKRFII